MRLSPSKTKRRIRMLCVAAAAATALVACSGGDGTPEQATRSGGRTSGDTVRIDLDPPRVTLLDPGSAQQVLSYGVPDADAPTQELPVRFGGGFTTLVDSGTGTQPHPSAEPDGLPVLNIDAKATVRAVDGVEVTAGETGATRQVTVIAGSPRFSGDATTLRSGENPDVDWDAELAGADGFTVSYATTPSGKPVTMSLHAPDSASDTGRAGMESRLGNLVTLAVVFPDEPVGTGARWTVESRITGSTTMLQTVTYTLTELDGRRVGLDVEVDQRPSIGALSLDALAPQGDSDGAAGELRVESAETSSAGHLEIDLDDPLPRAGGIAFTTRIIYAGDGSDVRVVQDSHSAIHFD
ncbi:hypothetical protein JIM95_002430 [Corynebacterium sp. CCM 8835]|uniref:Secreted protein n=1 Tax=Corynebacterium antarcticum TaxID=2800405 RepID=A0ABS1FJD9_9CORY|nr:hypothetical protein [Corynebacterium antarcticum]MCL0245011.1 hypothetical protein [Corynebacterium antarcticum]